MIKRLLCLLAVVSVVGSVYAETRNIVPRADKEGGIGTPAKRWANVNSATSSAETIFLNGVDITTYFGGGGSGGGISNVIVNGKTGVLSGSGSNVVSTVTLVPSDIGAASTLALASGLSAGSNYAVTVANAASNGAIAVSAASMASGFTAGSNYAVTVADAASNGAVAVARGFSVTNVTLAAGLNVTLNGGSAPVLLSNNSTITIAASGSGGGGGGISNVVVNGKTGVLSGSGSNILSTVTLVPADIGAANASDTNTYAPRSWVLGFSNAPASYNSADATIDVAMPDGTTGQLFEELWMPIKNTSGVPLTNGVCVRVEDASGALSGVRLVACTDTWDQVLGTIGLSTMTTATPINGDGKITTFGNVNDLDTTAFIEGSNLWLSATPGQLTMARPTAAGCKQILIGKCLRSHANQGRISVGVRIIPRPDDIGAVATNDARYLATLTNGGPVAIAATNAQTLIVDHLARSGTSAHSGMITNNQQSVVLGLSTGTTVADAVLTNEPVSLQQLEEAVNGLLSTAIYGATNIHPVLGVGYSSFLDALPSAQWTNTYVLGTTYALVGNRFYTNATAGGTTIPALSTFNHHVNCNVSALNGGVYYSRLVYVKSDLTATTEVRVGSVAVPGLAVQELLSTATTPTNITLGAGTWYLGVERYAKRDVGTAVSLSIYGGNGTPTRLEIPSSLSPSSTFATKSYVDNAIAAIPPQTTGIVQTVLAAFGSPTYYVTNTVVVSNSLDYAIPLAGNNIRVRWMNMFLSSTNEAATSKRAAFSMFSRNDRLCDSAIYSDTNQLYWAAPSTSAQAAGAATGTVADASGVVLMDRYAVGNGTRFDFLTATQATATVIYWGCTNKYATTGDANTKVSHANYLTPVFYDDDSGQSNAWCRFAWTTPYTGTVTTIMRYSK